MQELTAGTRIDVAALCPGNLGRVLGFRVCGPGDGRVPAGLQIWAVREHDGEIPGTVLTWGPGGPGAGDTRGEPQAAGLTLDLEQVLGQGDAADPRSDSRVVLAAVWPALSLPTLRLEVGCAGQVVAYTPLPVENLGPAGRAGAAVLARVYRRSVGLRLWVQVERLSSPARLERLLRLPADTLRFDQDPREPRSARGPAQSPARPAPPSNQSPVQPSAQTSPSPDGSPVPSAVSEPALHPERALSGGPLARLAAAWSALMGETPGSDPGVLAVEPQSSPASAPPTLAPRTAQVLNALEARLLALRRASDEDAEEARRAGDLLSPEHARRRARLSGLHETHTRIHAEAVALARRVRQLDALGVSAGARRPAEIAEVENAIETAVRALSAAIDQEAWALAGEPLAQSRARLHSETRFLESLDTEQRLPWDHQD